MIEFVGFNMYKHNSKVIKIITKIFNKLILYLIKLIILIHIVFITTNIDTKIIYDLNCIKL
ncbi:hypothetical protein SDC9_113561 [bioreactor metagenome]|uniref:Uncharacterized protein n=1 Tax=bioreactor metagenome TaxID=1076179 RepID=A0A645BPZ0_9ZZZZ